MKTQKKIRVIIDNRIRVQAGDSDLFEHIQARFTFDNPHRETLRFLNIQGWWAEPKRYETWSNDGNGWLSVPRGGLAKVKAEAQALKLDLAIEDKRCGGDKVVMPKHDLTLYPHQEEAVEAILARQTCLLRSPTGSGKTSIAMAAAVRSGLRTLVIVPNRVLLEQWRDRAMNELSLSKKEIGEVRGGTYRIGVITLGIAMSVGKHASKPEFAKQFGMVIGEECSLFGAKTFFSAIDPLPSKYRIGISQDHRRKDKKDFLIELLFGDIAKDLKQDDLVKSGHVLDVTIKVIPTDFRADWYGLSQSSDDDRELDFAKLINQISADRDRNRLIVEETRKLAQQNQIVLFTHTRDHCHTLEQTISGAGINTGLLIGGDDYAEIFRRSVSDLKQGKIQVGVGTYKAIALGVDIPRLGCGVCATPIAANQQLVQQVRGRICRTSTGKVSAELIYFWDEHVFPRHLENIARWNANTLIRDRITSEYAPAKKWLKENKPRQ